MMMLGGPNLGELVNRTCKRTRKDKLSAGLFLEMGDPFLKAVLKEGRVVYG